MSDTSKNADLMSIMENKQDNIADLSKISINTERSKVLNNIPTSN